MHILKLPERRFSEHRARLFGDAWRQLPGIEKFHFAHVLKDATNGAPFGVELVIDHLPWRGCRELSQLVKGEVMRIRPRGELATCWRFGVVGEEREAITSPEVGSRFYRFNDTNLFYVKRKPFRLSQMGPRGVFENGENHARANILSGRRQRIAAG